MKNKSLAFFVVFVTTFSSLTVLKGQHQDVEFGYDDASNPTAIVIDNDALTVEGVMTFESEFEELDPFDPGNFSSDQPGFATNSAEGLIVNAGDQIWIEVLNAADHSIFGAGYVNYCDPMTGQISATGRLSVLDNSGGTADLILDGATIDSGVNPQFVDLANSSGSIHDHVIIDLLDDDTAPFGAYGILCEIQSDVSPGDGAIDIVSEPVWIVWNHGLSSQAFETALKHFGLGLTQSTSDSFVALRGILDSGVLADSQQSDDSYLTYKPGFTLNNSEPPVWLEFETTLSNSSTSMLVVSIEDQASSVNLLRTIELMDWNTGSFSPVSSEDSPFNQDAVLLLNVSVGDFVQSGTGLVKTKVSWKANGFVLNFPWTVSIDQLTWFTE